MKCCGTFPRTQWEMITLHVLLETLFPTHDYISNVQTQSVEKGFIQIRHNTSKHGEKHTGFFKGVTIFFFPVENLVPAPGFYLCSLFFPPSSPWLIINSSAALEGRRPFKHSNGSLISWSYNAN